MYIEYYVNHFTTDVAVCKNFPNLAKTIYRSLDRITMLPT